MKVLTIKKYKMKYKIYKIKNYKLLLNIEYPFMIFFFLRSYK